MMELWVVISLIVALLALRRALGAERVMERMREEIATLAVRLSALEASPSLGGPPIVQPSDEAQRASEASASDRSAAEGSAALDRAPAEVTLTVMVGEVPPIPPMAPEPGADAPTQSTPAPPFRAAATAEPHAAREAESLEAQIGSRWLLYLGIGTLVLGLSYFVKYAFDSEWIAPPVRVALGLLAGLGLMAAGQRFVSRGLGQFGQALTGGGIGTLYLSVYAAHHWYPLLDRVPAFAAMIAVTVAGAVLADRQRSQPLAILSVAVGFVVPFLVGGGAGSQVTLFTYDLILVCGALYLAGRRAWPALNLVSYLLTLLTLYAWAGQYYQRRDYWATELFITGFLVLFLRMRQENSRAEGPVASFASVLLGLSPVLYHLASLAILRPHRGALFVYLIGFSVAGTIAAAHLRMPWLRLLVWIGVAVPCLDIASGRVAPGWLPGAWITLVAIFGVHLIAQIQALDEDRPAMPAPEILLLHGHGLWMLGCLWALASPRSLVSMPALAFGLASLYGALAFMARRWHAEAALHATALAAALAAVAVALKFSGPWLIVSLAAEGAALAWLGLRAGRGWLRVGGLGLLFVATLLAANRLVSPASVNAWLVINPRTLASLFVVAMLLIGAVLHHRASAPPERHGSTIAILIVIANLLVLAVVTSEIAAFYAARAWQLGERPGMGGSTWLAHQLTLSLAWAGYAVLLVAIGLRRRYRPVRYLAIGLFAVTMAKVFFVDLARLDRVYRMLSVIGLGLLLLLASYLYQRLRALDARDGAPIGPEPDAAAGEPTAAASDAARNNDPAVTP